MDPSCSDTVVYMRTSILMELLLALYGAVRGYVAWALECTVLSVPCLSFLAWPADLHSCSTVLYSA